MVVTANKALLAKYGKQIFGEAERNGVAVFYEAAIAGGIPIVKVLKKDWQQMKFCGYPE